MSSASRETMIQKQIPGGLTENQFTLATCSIIGSYLAALGALHILYCSVYGGKNVHHDFNQMYVWDHPEPNFTVSVAITEFWSVLSAIPLAGGLLCYQGLRYRVAAPVMAVFVGTFCMYNFALVSHLTLWKPIFQLTLTSVMTNCFSAFYLYGFLAQDLAYAIPLLQRFACDKCRMKIAVPSVAAVAYAAVNLPDFLGKGGGVWTLFYVQAPPVWVASIAALSLMLFSHRAECTEGYRMVCRAGFFLSLAMGLSYFECRLQDKAVLAGLGGFPAVHVAIHLSEQVGIYLYGISLAFLHHASVSPRENAQFQWLFGGTVPYFMCNDVEPTSVPSDSASKEATSDGAK